MENPEEVLQALDEFQKMRPSEIPRELEEYLCWVAKTGDPVYQWSLVKPLFREKLTRVMTDFYESCPTLELAPCPNVEQFNYDIMKCNLLELLESFANAPFTVQRICELLTAPRKEYNRVDKFMRAIEKNILVVSTREPGPAARRSENGEGMVNGSVDEDVPSNQATHEVEMESWVKDCTAETAVAVPTEDNSVPLLDTVIAPPSKIAKIIVTNEEASPMIQEKSEQPAATLDVTNSSVAISCRDIIAGAPNLTLPVQSDDPAVCEVENLSENGTETPAVVADVPDAVMNEDTSSQPSLDSEADDAESSSAQKLQTTFQTKDFVKADVKSPKFYAEGAKDACEDASERSRLVDPGIPADNISTAIGSEDSTEKTVGESKLSFECQESVIPVVESLLEKRPRVESEITDPDTGENPHAADDGISPSKRSCIVTSEVAQRTEDPPVFLPTSVEVKTPDDMTIMGDNETEDLTATSCAERLSSCENVKPDIKDEESKENIAQTVEDSLPEADRTSDVSESSRPIVEEPSCEEGCDDSRSKSPQHGGEQTESGVTIEEAMDDDTRINRSIVPDPIPIIEEPKETTEGSSRDTESGVIIEDVPIEEPKETAEASSRDTESGIIIEDVQIEEHTETILIPAPINIVTPPTIVEVPVEIPTVGSISDEVADVQPIGQEDITDVRNSPTVTEEKVEPAESMEVDGEESMPAFQQDEPMEQEPGDLVKS